MAKLEEVLTQLSDLDPEADYSVDVSENNISVKCNTDEVLHFTEILFSETSTE